MRSSRPTEQSTAWTADSLRELFAASARAQELDASVEVERASRREAYENAAAVLAAFDPAALQPFPPQAAEGADAVTLLHDRSDILPGAPGASPWTLRAQVRRAALLRMREPARWLEARAANGDVPASGLQGMLDCVLEGAAPVPDDCAADDIEHLLTVAEWLGDAVSNVPPLAAIRARANRLRLTAPFHAVAAQFQGREQELADLRDYVGVMPATAMLRGVKRQLSAWLGMKRRGPLVIYGVGGIGKSTLLAKFLLDHAMLSPELSFPFAYLDCDSPRLRSRDPLTLLVETCAQMAAQYPDYEAAFRALATDMENALFERGRTTGHASQTRTLLAEDTSVYLRSTEHDDQFIHEFLRLLDRALKRGPVPEPGAGQDDIVELAAPLLVVLDTFEEMQYSSADHLDRLWWFLGMLQQRCPRLRVVASGRAPATDRGELNRQRVEQLEVKDLDARSARELLRLLGVADELLRAQIQREFGGNPLTLRLIADAIGRERSARAVEGLERKSGWWSFTIDQALVQGQLYRRILQHLPGELSQLAHPGLVVRRINAQVIRHVLAEPCGIDVPDDDRAQELFEALRGAAWLVTLGPDGSLRHRQDMRQIMLRLIRREKQGVVDDIHRRAIAFYAERATPTNRAEEIYHRLQLEQDPSEIDSRWMDGVDDLLRGSSIDELPTRSQVYLAGRLGTRLPPERLRAARLEDRERHALPALRSLISSGHVKQARDILLKFGERSPTSPLHLIEAQVLLGLDRPDDAAVALDAALHAANIAGELPVLLEAAVLGAEIASLQGRTDAVIEHLEHAVALARQTQNSTRLSDAQLRLLDGYCDALDEVDPPAAGRRSLRARLAAEFAALGTVELQLRPDTTRRVISELAADNAALFVRGLGAVGFGELVSGARKRLTAAIGEFVAHTGHGLAAIAMVDGDAVEPASLAAEWTTTLLHRSSRGMLDDRALRMATMLSSDPGFRTAAADIMRPRGHDRTMA